MTLVTATNPRLIRCESNLEARVAYVMLARPDVLEITEQPSAVTYRDEHGRERSHTFDFLVTRKDGTRVAVAVKPAKIARRKGLKGLLKRIAAQMSRHFADAVLLVTEEDLPPALVQNAMQIHACRRGRCADHDQRVAALVKTLNGRVTVKMLVDVLGLGGAGFQAVVRAIADGVLALVGRRRIDYDSWLSPTGAGVAA